jgi:DNA-binding transcriptional LysR family regulator
VKVHVEYGRPNQVYEDVLNGVADFGFLAFPVRQPNLEIVPFRMDKLVFICHPQHPFAGQRSVKLNALAGQKFIGFESDIPIRKVVDKMLGSRSVEVQRVTEFDNIESVKRAVEIDAGVSIVPQGTVTQEVVMRTLVALPIEGGKFYRPLGILYKKNKVLSPAMKQFLAVLTAGI